MGVSLWNIFIGKHWATWLYYIEAMSVDEVAQTLNQAAIARFGTPPPTAIGAGSSVGAMPQLVPRVIQVLELANVARAEINAQYIGTEHLLLGILREGGGMAVTLLQDLNVDLTSLERQVLTTLSGATH